MVGRKDEGVSRLFRHSSVGGTCFALTVPIILDSTIVVVCGLMSAFFISGARGPSLMTNMSRNTPIFDLLVTVNSVFNLKNDSLVSQLFNRGHSRRTHLTSNCYFCMSVVMKVLVAVVVITFRAPVLRLLKTAATA